MAYAYMNIDFHKVYDVDYDPNMFITKFSRQVWVWQECDHIIFMIWLKSPMVVFIPLRTRIRSYFYAWKDDMKYYLAC